MCKISLNELKDILISRGHNSCFLSVFFYINGEIETLKEFRVTRHNVVFKLIFTPKIQYFNFHQSAQNGFEALWKLE